MLAIDIGTSSCKVAVFDKGGELIDSESNFYDVYYPRKGWAEQNPEEWWRAVCTSLQDIIARGRFDVSEIKGVGIDGQSWSAIPVNKDGSVLANTPIWMDTRAKEITARLNKQLGGKKFFDISGNTLNPSYSLPKILWMKEQMPDVYKKTYKFLQSNSYIVYKLTNVFSQDISQSYGYQCFDMKKGIMDEQICEEVGLDIDKIPKISKCHEVVGLIDERGSFETGLPVGIPVVAGGLDAACGALGVGVILDGETQEQGGQAGGMSICLDKYKADPKLILSYHVVPDKWLLQGGTVGGAGVPKWFLNHFGEVEKQNAITNNTNPYYEMDLLAEKTPVGAEGMIFLPYMAGERSPIWNPNAKGVFYGVDFTKTRGHFIRAIEEGVAFSLNHNLKVAEDAGVKIKNLRAMGGAANSELWLQIKADITNKEIVVPSSDTATTLGAAILAGVGVGIYKDFEEAINKIVVIKKVFKPNKGNVKTYKTNYSKYISLYKQLEILMTEDLQEEKDE